MKLDFFILADGVNVAEGKVYIHGGAITRIHPPSFPSPPLGVTAAIRLLVEPEEFDASSHSIVLDFRRRDGSDSWSTILDGEMHFDPRPSDTHEGEDQGFLVVAQMGLAFPDPGAREIRLRIDGQELATRGLFVTALDDQERPVK